MRVIPVVDLKGGIVVRAIRGDRARYRAIETPLAPGTSDPVEIARALLAFCPSFDCLYVADLDGIENRAPSRRLILELAAALPDAVMLVDFGAARPEEVAPFTKLNALTPVIGSESLFDADQLAGIARELGGRFTLSLDWRDGTPLGPLAVFEDPSLWPATVIVMTLDRVGSNSGPDMARLRTVRDMAGPREVLAAGGVRGIEDLHGLQACGCGALVATALHDGALPADELMRLLHA